MIQLITRSEDKKLEQMTFESESVLFHLDINTETLYYGCRIYTVDHTLPSANQAGDTLWIKTLPLPATLLPSPSLTPHPAPFFEGGGGWQGDPVYQRPCEQSKGRPSHSQFLPTPTSPPPAGCVCVGGVGFGGGGGGTPPLHCLRPPIQPPETALFTAHTGRGGPPIPPPLSRQMGPLSSEGSRQER